MIIEIGDITLNTDSVQYIEPHSGDWCTIIFYGGSRRTVGLPKEQVTKLIWPSRIIRERLETKSES